MAAVRSSHKICILHILSTNETLEVDFEYAVELNIIKELVSDVPLDEFPFRVPILVSNYAYLVWIIKFIQTYKGIDDIMIHNLDWNISWIQNLMNELSIFQKCELLADINEFQNNIIERALAYHIGLYIKSISPLTLEKTLKVSRKLSSDELHLLHKENEWMNNDNISYRRRNKQKNITPFELKNVYKVDDEDADEELLKGLKLLSWSMYTLVIKMI